MLVITFYINLVSRNSAILVKCACILYSQKSEGPWGLFLKSPRDFFGPTKSLSVNLYL